jgi:polysaccharide biosynthesis protein PslH
MRILFVSTHLPVPANSGQSIRTLSIIKALASSGHAITFLSFASRNRPADLEPLSSLCSSVELLEHEMRNLTLQPNYFARLRTLLKRQCYSLERFRSATMLARIQFLMTRTQYDLIVSDAVYALVNIPDTRVPIILNTHNVEYLILHRYAQLEKNPAKKLYAMTESTLMRVAERKASGRVAAAMVCSNPDRDVFQSLRPDASVAVIPNVVDTDLIKPDLESTRAGDGVLTLLFQGVMDWYPNRDAVEFFIGSILPAVRVECPKVRFVVAGRNPPRDFVDSFRSQPYIEFTGTVPDMRPYLASASVVVVPLRLGGGTRIKILEACAAGKPVVSTSIGAEGLDLEPDKDIVLADSPAEFARDIIALLRDPARCDALARSGRESVERRYSQVTLKSSLEALFSSRLRPSCDRIDNPLV